MPIYNGERFLEEAIESCFAQTYEHWELLLIDDNSTDASAAIARRYAERNPGRVRYLEHEGHANHGACASRNLGIREAIGEYIAFLDADDVWVSRKLEQQVARLRENPDVGLVYGLVFAWCSWTGRPEDCRGDVTYPLGVAPETKLRPPEALILFLRAHRTDFIDSSIPSPSNFIIRRDVLNRIGGFEESFIGMYQIYEDHAFLAKVALDSALLACGESWTKWRRHPASVTEVVWSKGLTTTARLFYLNWLTEYLTRAGSKDRRVRSALRKDLWKHRHPSLYSLWADGLHVRGSVMQRAIDLVPSSLRHSVRTRWPGLRRVASRWVR